MNKTSRFLQYSIITLIFLLLASPLVFTGNMFFPYITGKAFYFRTIVEIITALYVILVCFDKSFLPKKSPIAYALGAFLIIMGLATIFSVAPAKSFWSNFERMEGYVMLIHLGLLFLVTSSVMKARKMWVYLFHTSMAISIIMGLIALQDLSPANASMISGGRIQGTLGNSSYLGVYALLHVFLAAFFLLSHFARKNAKDMLSRIFGYALIIIFNIVILFNTGTRGALVGLGLGVLLTSLILATREKQSKKIRNTGIGILVAAIVVIAFLGAIRGTEFAKSNSSLDRYSALVTWNISGVLENQGYARAGLLWPMAWAGVQEKPLLGWGQDNFGYVFAKYYNPAAYAQEQWFDRTHNVFLDWMIAGGFLGLLGYLSLFVALIIVLWSKHKDAGKGHKWPLIERATISGLLLAYFVHNFFVFDNLTSYIIFFLLLAYFHERNVSANESAHHHNPEYVHVPLLSKEGSQWFVVTVSAVALVLAVYFVNYKPYKNSADLIRGLQALGNHYNSSGAVVGPNPSETLDYFKSIFDSNTTLGLAETRERLVEVASAVITSTSTSRELATEYDALTRDQYSQQLEKFPGDPRYNYFFALYLSKIGDIKGALEQVQKAVALSPAKQQFSLQEGMILLNTKQFSEAAVVLKRAFELEPKNDAARLFYAVSLIYSGRADEATVIVAGSNVESDGTLVQAYLDVGRFDIIENIAKKKISANPNDVQLHVSLAALYLKAKRNNDSIRELRIAADLEPGFKPQADEYIKMIQSGKDPSQQ
jgi:O-antigen ligase/Flp pilus assembly protein TadD